ncbi:MAG: glycosyltransferase family 2 protein, partial [Candidatus Brocadia sp.]
MTITDLHTTQNNSRPLAKTSNDRPTISACMIVKNEEKFLPQCLKSIKDAVDEIIIVDTGSTDKSVEIAQSFGAKVYHHPWNNSFSEARNHSLSYATCDWILQIDADETLEQADIPLLHKSITANSYNAIFVAIYSDLPGGRSKHYYTRVFRRGKARFEGIVHNQLIFEGKAIQSEIRFYH